MKAPDQEPNYAGKVFADPELTYAEAAQAFVKASRPLSGPYRSPAAEKPYQRSEFQELRQKEIVLRNERREIHKSRALEDAAWQAIKDQKIRDELSAEELGQPKLRVDWGVRKARREQQKNLREQQRQQFTRRQDEDEHWRLARRNLREKIASLPNVTPWIAILLITDNCTRQCLGLALFVAGSHVTADMLVAALRILLPASLQFLISDRGRHFTADVFKQFAINAHFVHVVIARHRPQSNGIAERFVRTLKEWLANKAWRSDKELSDLLRPFLLEYNDCSHQGLPIPGLSPNEYANRIWVM
jgi:transposase InsO family protein